MNQDEQKKESQMPSHSLHHTHRTMFEIAGATAVIILCFAAAYLGTNVGHGTLMGANISSFEDTKNDGNTVVTETEKDISSLADAVSPSIVSIVTSGTTTSAYGGSQQYESAGTGMIVSADGYIMTNKHVIAGASKATVIRSDGTTYNDVKVIGQDPLNDIAFLKVDNVSDLPAVKLGDSKTLRIGQQVVAIGNALGQYQNTVTTGIVSGLGRPVVASSDGTSSGAESLTDLIQTDAAINAGNSGGPLLNMKGQVIGMNTAVAQDAQSIGFAIPIGATKGVLEHLTKTGKIAKAIVGVKYVSITPEVKTQYKLDQSKGDLVTGLSSQSSPAAKAGIKKNDIIIAVNGKETGPGRGVATLVSEFEPGDTVQLTLVRAGEKRTLNLTLGEYK